MWLEPALTVSTRRSFAPTHSPSLPLSLSLPGYMVNLCAVVLELCKPFFTSSSSGPKLGLISLNYPSSPFCRLDLHGEPCLANTLISRLTPSSQSPTLTLCGLQVRKVD